jgi:hypothetical protein
MQTVKRITRARSDMRYDGWMCGAPT